MLVAKLKAQNLPIPQDLEDDFGPKVMQEQGENVMTPGVPELLGTLEQPEAQIMNAMPQPGQGSDTAPPGHC